MTTTRWRAGVPQFFYNAELSDLENPTNSDWKYMKNIPSQTFLVIIRHYDNPNACVPQIMEPLLHLWGSVRMISSTRLGPSAIRRSLRAGTADGPS